MSDAFLRVRNLLNCPCYSPPSSRWPSICRPQRHSGLKCRKRYSRSPTRSSNDGVDGPLAASECQTAVIESAANGSHPWARLLCSDWTWRSMFFRCTGSMQRERRFCASSFGVRRFWRSSVDCRAVWWAGRRARRRTSGRGSCALGHEVRLMPAQYVKAYIKRNKHDAADAEAICEAVGRPTMRFVPVKTADQQAAVLLHRGRERLVRQRTGLVNALRGHLAEFG